ncbi:MAG: PAS domain S-box protein [bacterium]
MENLFSQSLLLLIKTINEGIIITDKFGIIKEINSVALEVTAGAFINPRGISIDRIFNKIDSSYIDQQGFLCDQAFFTNIAVMSEITLVNKTNEKILFSVTPIKSSDDTILGYLFLIKDSFNKQNNPTIVAESETLYKESLEFASDIIYITDMNGNFTNANYATLKLLGYSREELLQLSVFDVIVPEYVDGLKRHYYRQFVSKARTTYLETHILSKSGEKIWVGQNVNLIIKEGKVTGFHAISRDITERKQTEAALLRNEEMLKMIINIIPDRVYMKDADGKFVINNKAHLAALGVAKQEEAVGKTDFDFRDYAIAVKYKNQDMEIITSNTPIINCLEHEESKNGKDKWMLISKFPFQMSSNSEIGIVGISHDITQQRNYELQNTLLANALKSINECVTITDLQNNLIFINKSFMNTYQYNEKELLGKNISIISCNKNPLDINDRIMEATLKGGWEGELINLKKDGTEIPIYLSTTAIFDKNNLPFAMIGVARDITLIKKHENEILKLIQTIIHSPVSIIITDINGIIEYVNPKALEMTGYSDYELIGKRPNIFKSGFTLPTVYNELWKTITAGDEWRGELYNRKKNGVLYWEFASISSIKNNDGKIMQYIAFKDDITSIKELEFSLKLAKEKAEAASEIKDAFIANVSHEIRTPINGMLGMISLIKEGFSNYITSVEEEYFSSIDRSSRRIIRTTELILNFSRFLIEDFPIEIKRLNLTSIIESVVHEYKPMAVDKNIKLVFENNLEAVLIESDSYAIYQIISNIMDNAVKFTNSGNVKISLFKPEQNKIKFSVVDTGVGISKEYLPNLFEPYTQEENGYTRSYDGLGLGLALTKLLIDKIGAEIVVKSIKGEGTAVSVTFKTD